MLQFSQKIKNLGTIPGMLHGITPLTTTLNTKTDPYASAKAGQVTKPPRHARQKTHILGISPGFEFVVVVFWVYVAGDQTLFWVWSPV